VKRELNGLLEEAIGETSDSVRRGLLIARERGLVSGEGVEWVEVENVLVDAINSLLLNEAPKESKKKRSSKAR
jgi:hypothetical protein